MAHSATHPAPLPDRQTIRLPGFDYTRTGMYFITICTEDRRCHFGEVRAGAMHNSPLGDIVQTSWGDLPAHHPRIQLDAFQFMPNHVHGVLWLADPVGATQTSPLRAQDTTGSGHPGDAGVAPTESPPPPAGVRATQASPLRGVAPTRASRSPFRLGHGYDLHRLQPAGVLMLGGLEVAQGLSPVAHSDGDVVLHALVDALLGAMGWGDIGDHFPNTDARWKGAPSRVFVDDVYARVTAAGYRVGNVDVTVLAERPKLTAFKRPMAEHVAGMLGVTPEQVNVKAGTNEGCDAIGRGEAIAAHAVVLLVGAD